jgi:hypothetical protein
LLIFLLQVDAAKIFYFAAWLLDAGCWMLDAGLPFEFLSGDVG